jgi:hypothetical protein
MAQPTKFFDYIEIKYKDLTYQLNNWLQSVYKRSAINFNSASPFGQIINVMKELFQHNIIYLKNAVKILDITQSQNKKVIQQTARISGYSTSRSISATGTLKFQLKQGIDINTEIKDSIIVIKNGLILKNKTNSLYYSVKLNTERNIFPLSNSNTIFYLPIIQGKYETQELTGKGTSNQSFSINIPGNKQIENFNYSIYFNGTLLKVKDHIYDMLPAEYACVVKSGFDGGIDIYFGNENFGFIPNEGSIITVRYLLSDGSIGEIFNPITNDWKIEDEVFDGQGNSIAMDKLFNIEVETDINFSSDGESIEFLKSAIPYTSRNFVLGTPNQFNYHLRRLNMFSKVNSYNKLEDNDFSISDTVIEDSIKKINDSINKNQSRGKIIADLNNFNELYAKYKNNLNDNEIYLYLIPSIKKYFNDNINYFNIPFDVFYLDDNEQNKVLSYLRQLGTMSITAEVKIIQPIISRYVMHVYIRRFDYANEDNIRQEIISQTSDYLLNNNRFDRITKADLIQIYKNIDGIDSASVYFISKKNEDYHKKGQDLGYAQPVAKTPKYNTSSTAQFKPKVQPILAQSTIIKNGVAKPNAAYDPTVMLGIDKVHGDIICDKDEYVIIRGGWRDRKGIWYNEDPNTNGLSSINVVFDGITYKS